MSEPLEGLPVKIGRKTFIVPPMSLGAAKRTREDREKLADPNLDAEERLEAATRVIFFSLKRNYPDLQLEEVEDRMTLGNFRRVVGDVAAAWSFDEDAPPKASAESPQT